MSHQRRETRWASAARWVLLLAAFLMLRPASAWADWVVYNDLWAGPGTHPNTTVWNPFGTPLGGAPTSGPLTNIQTGARLPVTLTASYSGDARVSSTAGVPALGTPAYLTFNSYVDWNTAYGSGSTQNTAQCSSAGGVTWTFTGLNAARRYSFKGTSVRGEPTYTNRWTLCEIQGADSFTPAHTSGVLTSNQLSGQLTASQAVFQTGDNTAGEMVVWENIAPGADGSFAITSTKFSGTIPGASTAGTSGYALTFLRLEELPEIPTIAITSPTNNATFGISSPISITASAAGTPSPTNVEFYADGSLIGSRTGAPYTLTWTNPPLGSHQLLAVAWNSSGAVTSAPVNVTVVPNSPPAVTLPSPLNGTVFGTTSNTAPIAMSATATDSDGTVTNVEFYGNGVLLGSDATSPFTFTWTNAPLGNHQLTAVAADNSGLRATSAVVNVTVSVPMTGIRVPPSGVTNTFDALPAATEWSMRNVAGTAPTSSNALDTAVQSNAATSVNSALGTQTSYANSGNANWNSTARTIYTAPTGNAYTLLMATLRNDTGANITTFDLQYDLIPGNTGGEQITNHHVYYSLTGAAGTWVNIPALCEVRTAGTLTASVTLAGSWANGAALYLLWADPNASGYTDPYYAIDNFSVRPLLVPGVFLTAPTNGAVVGVPGLVLLAASVVGVAATNVEFYANGALVGATASVPYTVAWNDPPLGSNQLLAVAWHGSGAVTSAPVNVTVVPNSPPSVNIASPVSGAAVGTHSNSAQVAISAAVADPDGTVTNVEFYADGVRLGADAASPFVFTWSDAALGDHQLFAVASDNGGLRVTSAPVNISVVISLPDYDPTADFSIINGNPNGVWSYGWMQVGFTGPLNLYTSAVTTATGPNWQGNLAANGTPAVWKNTSGSTQYGVPNGMISLHPGPGTQPSVLRWTAPAAGNVRVQGQFYPGDSGTMQVAVRLADQQWWAASDAGAFDLQTNAAAGTTIDFAVYGGYGSGNTPLSARITLTPGPLAISIAFPMNNALVGVPALVPVTADLSGQPAATNVVFYVNGNLIGSRTNSPWTLTWTNPPLGSHQLLAVAWNSSGAVTSAPVSVTVVPNSPPTIALSSPSGGAVFWTSNNTAQIVMSAMATDPDGTVTNVDFYGNGAWLGSDSTNPFAFTWPNAPLGSNQLVAVATDNGGLCATSAPVSIHVRYRATWPGFVVTNFKANITVSSLTLAEGVITNASQQTAVYSENVPVLNYFGTVAEGHYADNRTFPGLIMNSDVDNFVVEARATITIPAAGQWTFGVSSDDGFGLQIGAFSMSYPGTRGAADTLQTFNFTAAGEFPLRLVYFDFVSGAELELFAVQGTVSSWNTSFRLVGDTANGGLAVNSEPIGGLTIQLTSPTNGSIFTLGAPVTLAATAASGTGAVSQVAFYSGAGLIGSDPTAPYSVVWSNAPLGTNPLYAVAIDDSGQSATSAVVMVVVMNPGVFLTSPADGTTFTNTNPITVTASVVPEGMITNMEFFVDGVKFGEDATAPFSATWNTVVGGSHRLTAVGRSTTGASYDSAPVNIAVPLVLVSRGSVWKYLDNGTDQGTAWRASGFDDSGWTNGPAELGYGDGGERTELCCSNAVIKYITYYFRQTFVAHNPASYTNLILRVLRDDGAVVYLNGIEVARYNLPAGVITNGTLAFTAADDGTIYYPTNALNYLVEGDNILAVEIHQSTNTSTDISFDLELSGIPIIVRSQVLAVALASPADNASYVIPAAVPITAIAAGQPLATNLQIYADGVQIGSSASSSYSMSWSNVLPGSHVLMAVATGDGGIQATSSVVNITVRSNYPPVVSLTNPADNAAFMAPANIALTATATDDFGISTVAYYQGANKLGELSKSPYQWNWNGVPAGNYQLQVVATDLYGLSATSGVVNITVTNNNPPMVSLTAPLNNATFAGPTNITIMAVASDSDGVVAKVEFILDGSKLGESGTIPYSLTWSNVILSGVYSLYAVATDNAGIRATSVVVSVTVNGLVPPVVAITNPMNNATFTAPATVNIQAAASDSDGTVTNVDFYANTLWLGQVAAAPFNLTWTNATAGNYALTAVATDHSGLRATSAPVNIVVSFPSAPLQVSYNFDALPAATNWSTYAMLGAVGNITTRAQLEAAVQAVSGGLITAQVGNSSANPPAAVGTATWSSTGGYLQTRPTGINATALMCTMVNTSATAIAAVNIAYDYVMAGLSGTEEVPGHLVYYSLTGQPNSWVNIPELSLQPAGRLSASVNLSSVWAVGTQLYILWADDNGSASPDWALQIDNFVAADDNQPKAILTSPANNSLLVLPDKLTISATVASFTNAVTNVTFFADSTRLGEVTASPYSFLWTNATPGTYQLRALATEVGGFSVTSAPITVRVQNNTPPTVAITAPPNGSSYTAPSDIDITVNAGDSDGSVTNVDVLANGALINRRTVPSFTFTWSSVPMGIYNLTAVAKDNLGFATTSSVARVFVLASSAPTVGSFVPASGVVSNLTQVTVNFSEPVDGVKASDLLVNSQPAASVVGSNATYTFQFPPPPEGLVVINWAATHAIVDRENPPKAFNGGLTGESSQYTLTDMVRPAVMQISPTPGASVPSLSRVEITFSEPVVGVDASDLLVNEIPATKVNGAQTGPYVFEFVSPVSGLAQLSWSTNHGIHDVAQAQNSFAGGTWNYTIDPTAPETSVVINEIMYHPASENSGAEFIELHNRAAQAVHLLGWRITGGVNFTLPDVTLAAGGYLVVAADVGVFSATYSGVNNVVGGWTGKLSNRDDDVRLRNALGTVINSVHYATEGDWAIRQRGPNDAGAYGWEWYAPHDGRAINTANGATESNKTLELLNPALANDNGQNWLASVASGGSPGRANSWRTNDIAPLVYDVIHSPVVPNATQAVTITARIVDEAGAPTSAMLYYRDVTTTALPSFVSTNMFDDGLHNDGAANDGVYGAIMPAQPLGTVIEFYVSASDAAGQTRTWPAAARQRDGTFAQTANAHYQVDEDSNNPYSMPYYRLVLTGAEAAELLTLSSSDAEMNCTFITSDGGGLKVRYCASVRIRGAGSRGRPTKNWRVNIPIDRKWNNLSEINLNTQVIHAQLVGSLFSLKSGMPCASARPVQVRLNGVNRAPSGMPPQGNGDYAGFGTYLLVEPINGEWAANHFPDDSGGNAYRGSIYPWTANLDYLGTNFQSYINAGYAKTCNQSENDWTDLVNMTYALSPNTPDAAYVQAVKRNVNVQMFMRYFAVGTIVSYYETSLFRGVGDDYAMYRGANDPRFLLIPHDFDTILGQGDSSVPATWPIWHFLTQPATTASGQYASFLNRFMHQPEFVPLYYAELKRMCDTTYSPAEMNATLDQALGGWVPANTVTAMKNYVANRNSYVRSQIPLNLTINTGLSIQSGYLYTTSPNVTLTGRANAIDTRSVRVGDSPAVWSAFNAAWTNTVTLQPGINRLTLRAFNASNVEFDSATVEIWYDNGSVQTAPVAIAADTTWTAVGGPYNVASSITVNSGVTLTIQPGTTVYLGSGANITVANGGRLLAEGTAAAPIRFSRTPGTATSWGGITVNGGAVSPETRIAYAHFEFNGSTAIHTANGTVFLDHLTFGNTAVQYLSLDSSSFVVQDCLFPSGTAYFELVHGTGGIKSGGRGIFQRNFFGIALSQSGNYNDVLDFTGGNRNLGQPIIQFYDNVFIGSGDDLLDLDGTDAWIEHNIFLHTHKNGSPDSSSAISGGLTGSDRSEITIIGNLIYDCDHAANAKEGYFYTFFNNTIMRTTKQGGTDTESSVVLLADAGTAEGAGAYLEGNIIYEAETLVGAQVNGVVTYSNNIIYALQGTPWTGPGGGNVNADPLFKHLPTLAETTNFTTWARAQVLWDWFSLQPGSPAVGTGPNGIDLGGVKPLGVSISGEPAGVTGLGTATLRVGVNRTGNGIPTGGFPNGAGFTHYKYRLDGGPWSAETPISTPITLSGVASGPHYVEAVGKNDAGQYQDDAILGPDATITRSATWIVNPTALSLRLNEVLARNDSAVPVNGKYPDLIELYNSGPVPVDLAGMSLSDSAGDPRKYVFPPGAVIGAGQYLVVYADNETVPVGYHTGFTLKQEGDDLYLFTAAGRLVDSIAFGPQVADLSLGRLTDGNWALNAPTFSVPNRAAHLGDAHRLKINEWQAASVSPAVDFIELYNPGAAPVNLSGLYLTDTPESLQGLHQIAPLSFIAGSGYAVFLPDGSPNLGPTHLNFQLASEQGMIGLFDAALSRIDWVAYGPQTNNVAFGCRPNGSTNLAFLSLATPGGPNPVLAVQFGAQMVINEVMAKNIKAVTNSAGATPEWIELYNPTTNLIVLADMSLSDDITQPRKYVFPAGLVLPSRGYLFLWCDGGAPASTNNTGFGISANGGAVYLFDESGPIDYVAYGVQANDYSIGRISDASTNWVLTIPTPGSQNIPAALGSASSLKINEWMADPASGADWFELYNSGLQPVALAGLWLTDDTRTPASRMRFQIPALSFMGTDMYGYERFWADNAAVAEPTHCNFALRAGGEWLGVSLPDGTLIDGLQFGPQLTGVSEGRLPDGATNIVAFPTTSTPGDANFLPLINVVINEMLSASPTNSSLEDAIELHNVSGAPVDVTGWYLSNARRALDKFQIPFTVVTNPGPVYVTNRAIIPAGGYLVFYQYQFYANPDDAASFTFDGFNGDEVYLSATDAAGQLTGYRAKATFDAAELGVSFGRYTNSVGNVDFTALSQRTFGVDLPDSLPEFRQGTGLANAYPKVGPVVFSEIMYRPPDFPGAVDNVRDEYLELHNPTASTVPLYDPAHPTNTWHLRGGVDFDFPTNVSLPPGGYLVVVSFDPVNDTNSLAGFRATYPQLPANAAVCGPYTGKLNNNGESVDLRKPGEPVAGDAPYILVEHVKYNQVAPWDPQADGTGKSLGRVNPALYGNDPANWIAGPSSPGGVYNPNADSDGDGIPDWWVQQYFGHSGGLVGDQSRAEDDPDRDGMNNLQEYLAGTNPVDPTSVLRIQLVSSPVGGNAPMEFFAVSNHAYTVEYQTKLDSNGWTTVQSYPPVPTNRVLRLVIPDGSASGFFRLRSP